MIEVYEELHTVILQRISNIIKELGYTQKDVIQKCSEMGYSISQPELSRILAGKVDLSLKYAIALSYVCEVDLNQLVAGTEVHNINIDHEFLKTNISDAAFDGWRGIYHTLFMSTAYNEDKIIRGKLIFEKSLNNDECKITYFLDTGERDDNGNSIMKKYNGQACISNTMRALYVILCGESSGELCFLTFRYRVFQVKNASCRLGMALTVSAGETQVPVAHKILITRNPIYREEQLNEIMAIMHHNGQALLIEEKDLESIALAGNETLNKVVKVLEKEPAKKIKEIRCDEIISKLSRERCSNIEIARALASLMKLSFNNDQYNIEKAEDNLMFDLLNGYGVKE